MLWLKIITFHIAFFVVGVEGSAQRHLRDTLELLSRVHELPEIKERLNSSQMPTDFLIIMCVKSSTHKTVCPLMKKVNNLTICFYRRVDMNGFNINSWLLLDSMLFEGNRARLNFKLIRTKDSWEEEFDVVDLIGEVHFVCIDNRWELERKKLN